MDLRILQEVGAVKLKDEEVESERRIWRFGSGAYGAERLLRQKRILKKEK